MALHWVAVLYCHASTVLPTPAEVMNVPPFEPNGAAPTTRLTPDLSSKPPKSPPNQVQAATMVGQSYKKLALVATAATATGVAAERQVHQANMTVEAAHPWSLYSFAQSWQPEFCHGQSSYVGCSSPDPFWSTSFTIHGLWPDVTSGTYPSSCTSESFSLTKATSRVSLDALNKYWPNVKSDPSSSSYTSFWQHEWSTHGTCSGLDQATYFQAAVSMMVNDPTPDFVSNNVGSTVSADDVRSAYGGSDQVVLQCSGRFLRQVLTCWTRNSDNTPGTRRACPPNLLAEDNCSGSSIAISSF